MFLPFDLLTFEEKIQVTGNPNCDVAKTTQSKLHLVLKVNFSRRIKANNATCRPRLSVKRSILIKGRLSLTIVPHCLLDTIQHCTLLYILYYLRCHTRQICLVRIFVSFKRYLPIFMIVKKYTYLQFITRVVLVNL